jgi:hypothetical protein
VDELLHDALDAEQRLHTVKDLPYLHWRYAEGPLSYMAVRDERGGRLQGLAVFRLRRRRTVWEAAIEELVVRPGDRASAGRLLAGVAASSRVALVSCLLPARTAARTAARARGFIPWRGSLALMIKQPEPGFTPSPDRLAAWALGLGDVEIL